MGKTAASDGKCEGKARGPTQLLLAYPAPTKKHSLGGAAPKEDPPGSRKAKLSTGRDGAEQAR